MKPRTFLRRIRANREIGLFCRKIGLFCKEIGTLLQETGPRLRGNTVKKVKIYVRVNILINICKYICINKY